MADRIGTDGVNDVLEGTILGDFMDGKGGNDTLTAKSGADTIIGGAGSDDMFGEGGDDVFTVTTGDMVAGETYSGSSGTDTLRVSTSGSNFIGSLADSVFSGFERIAFLGSDFHSLSLTSAQEAANPGLAITGSAGSDSLFVDITAPSGGTNLSDMKFASWSAGDQVIVNLSDGANVVTGSGVSDLFQSVGAGDSVNGGAGNDEFRFIAGEAAAAVTGGSGTDALRLFIGADMSATKFSSIEHLIFSRSVPGTVLLTLDAAQFGSGISSAATFEVTNDDAIVNIKMKEETNLSLSSLKFIGFDVGDSFNIFGDDDGELITGSAAADSIGSNGGEDTLLGGAGDDNLFGGSGIDTMLGGAGDDFYFVQDEGDIAAETILGDDPGGTDQVLTAISHTLSAFVENLLIDSDDAVDGTGNGLANTITGDEAGNALSGLSGNDTLLGGKGADRLTGGLGADVLTGGNGKDRYIFDSTADSVVGKASRDVIKGFAVGADKIDLRTLDARSDVDGNQDLVLDLGGGLAAGEVRIRESNGDTFIEANTDGVAGVDFQVLVQNVVGLTDADLLI